jgi:hypothetical protein
MGDSSTDKQLPLFETPLTSQLHEPQALGPLQKAPARSIAGSGNSERNSHLPPYHHPQLPLFNAPPSPTQAPNMQEPKRGDVNDKGEVYNGIQWCRDESNDPKLPYWQE